MADDQLVRTATRIAVWIIFGGGLLALVGPSLYRLWRRRVSITWPLTTAKFLDGKIEKECAPEGGNPIFTLYASYSYKVAGVSFPGEYTERINEADGQHLLRSLENDPLYVRYNPNKIDDSVLDPYRDVRPDPSSLR